MVLLARREALNRQIKNRSRICKRLSCGVCCVIISILVLLLDPIHRIVNYNLRLRIGSILCNILQTELTAAHIGIYFFNVTNADSFMYGDDPKLKLEEVGPFVYQEYLRYENLEMSEDGATLSMWPRYSAKFVPEASIGDPKETKLNILNLPMLTAAAMLSNYPGFVQFMFNALSVQKSNKPIINMDVHSFVWGYKDPLLTTYHKLAPGVVYFDSLGLLDRLYDNTSDYKVTVDASEAKKFQVQSVTKYRNIQSGDIKDVEVSIQNFTGDVYEGTGYPPDLTPQVPINLYRMGVCKTFELEYLGRKNMEYGGEGFIYTLSGNNFAQAPNPVSKNIYPAGLMDISKCYYGLPYVVSKAHFLDADPKLLDYVEGLSPDKDKHAIEFVIDRRVGVSFETKATMQVNIALDNVAYNKELRKLNNTILPIVRFQVDQPRMTPWTIAAFYLVYAIAPYVLIFIEIVLFITGAVYITKALKTLYYMFKTRNKTFIIDITRDKRQLTETLSGIPLIIDDSEKYMGKV